MGGLPVQVPGNGEKCNTTKYFSSFWADIGDDSGTFKSFVRLFDRKSDCREHQVAVWE